MLTARGMGVAIIVGALFILGAVTHYPEVGVIAAAGLGAVLIGLGWVLRRPHLEVLRTIEPARVERGGLAVGLVTVTNPGRFTSSSTMALERFGGQKLPFEVPRLQAGGTKRTTYRLPTERRAVVDVGPVNVVRQDPFGLWRSSQRVGSVERLWVHPRTHLLLGHPLGRTRSLDGPDADNVPQG